MIRVPRVIRVPFLVQTDAAIATLYKTDPTAAIEFATTFGETIGMSTFNEWTSFWMWLFASFRYVLVLYCSGHAHDSRHF